MHTYGASFGVKILSEVDLQDLTQVSTSYERAHYFSPDAYHMDFFATRRDAILSKK